MFAIFGTAISIVIISLGLYAINEALDTQVNRDFMAELISTFIVLYLVGVF